MNEEQLNFSDDLELYVDVSCDEFPATKGHLVFRCKQRPCLSIDDHSWLRLILKNKNACDTKKLVVKCAYKKDNYYLYFNDIRYNMFYPKYVVKSDNEYNYSRFYMSIPGLFNFFSGARGFILSDGELKKKIDDYFLKVGFDYLQTKYSLSISHNFSVTTKVNETIIREDAVLCLQKEHGYISFDDAKSLSFKMLNFFSLIFGVGLSIKYISLGGDDNGGGNYSPFYFANPYSDYDTIKYPAETLVTHPSLLTKNDWNLMLNNFFTEKNKSEFEDIWTRFVSLQTYKGFWEYKILGYASILDVYSQKLLDKEKSFKIQSSKMKLLKKNVTEFLKEASSSLEIDKDDNSKKIIESFCDYINDFKNTLSPTFKERYTYVLNLIEPDLLEVINFTDENFIVLKKIRDSVAHGKPVRITSEGDDGTLNISTVFILLRKLVILLSCLSFKVLGINEKRFAKMIVHSHNHTKMNALLDMMKLDVYCEEAKVVKVDENTFSQSRELFAFDFVIQENHSTGKMEFNNSLLLKMMNDFKTIHKGQFQYNDFCHYVYDNYNLNAIFCIEVLNKVYCVCNEEVVCLHSVPWITY